MANAMPHATLYQTAFPGRQVISLSGDADFTMLMGDFSQLAAGLPVKVVVFTTARWASSRSSRNPRLLDFGTEFKNPNFAAY